MRASDTDTLVDELRRLVGWPTPNVVHAQVVLRRMASADGAGEQTAAAAHRAVLRMLDDAIEDLTGSVEVVVPGGRVVSVDAARARRAYRLLFWIGRNDRRAGHDRRRAWAIAELGLNLTVDYWRREGPEDSFLRALAQRMRRQGQVAERYLHESFDVMYSFSGDGRLIEHRTSARLRALVAQDPFSELSLMTDSYPGHVFRLVHQAGCSTTGSPEGEEGLPLHLRARGPAVRPGDILDVASVFAVEARVPVNHAAWTTSSATERASVRLHFHPLALPVSVWRFENAASPEEGIADAQSQPPVAVLAGSCHEQYSQPRRDRWFGLAWQWPPAVRAGAPTAGAP